LYNSRNSKVAYFIFDKIADIIGLYDQSFQALALQLPKRRLGMGINIFPNRHTEIQFEYYKDYAYKNSVTASGLNYAMTGRSKVTDTYALQLIVNF